MLEVGEQEREGTADGREANDRGKDNRTRGRHRKWAKQEIKGEEHQERVVPGEYWGTAEGYGGLRRGGEQVRERRGGEESRK